STALNENAALGEEDGGKLNRLTIHPELIKSTIRDRVNKYGNIKTICQYFGDFLPIMIIAGWLWMRNYRPIMYDVELEKMCAKYRKRYFEKCEEWGYDPKTAWEDFDFRDKFDNEVMIEEDLIIVASHSSEWELQDKFWYGLIPPLTPWAVSKDGRTWLVEGQERNVWDALLFACDGDKERAYKLARNIFWLAFVQEWYEPGFERVGPVVPSADDENYIFPSEEEYPNVNKIPETLAELSTPQPGDESELLDNRFLTRSNLAMLYAVTGIGKSVLTIQACILWILGKAFFNISPSHPLVCWVIQSENDAGDMAEMRDGVVSMLTRQGIPESEVIAAMRKIRIFTEKSRTGTGFIEYLESLLSKAKKMPDIIIIDPLYAFLGDDVCNQKAVSTFLRNSLNPILERYNIGCIIVHHTAKPSKDARAVVSQTYLGAGSAELSNFPRAILTLEPTKLQGIFKLSAPKRGTRLGWKDHNGNPTISQYIAHSKEQGVIYWREPEPEEIAELVHDDETSKAGRKKKPLKDIASRVILDLVNPVEKKTLQIKIRETYNIGRDNAKEVIALILDSGKVAEKRGKDNKRFLVISD
ncbi:MAG: AAA family ATPase, partial [Victivallales bacterium]